MYLKSKRLVSLNHVLFHKLQAVHCDTFTIVICVVILYHYSFMFYQWHHTMSLVCSIMEQTE